MTLSDAQKSIEPNELHHKLSHKKDEVCVIDIRPQLTNSIEAIGNATLVYPADATSLAPQLSSNTLAVIYCSSGLKSASLVDELHKLGFTRAVSLTGGFDAWQMAGLPSEYLTATALSAHSRYSRQTQLASIGEVGQAKLKASRVLILGMGGLGCPASQYLVAAGVGHLGLVDFDRVELSNLQRQILFRESDLGTLKVNAAKQSLNQLNSDVEIFTYPLRFSEENAVEILSQYDLVLHGTDNFATRYLVNRFCAKLNKPLIEGAVQEFIGQVAVFDFRTDGPCYQCVFPEAPTADTRLSCTEIGVLGVLPGMIGTLQATEALKMILNLPNSFKHQLLVYDALQMQFKTLTLKKNPKCPICSDHRQFSNPHSQGSNP